jgi:23S rRNA pseudouridine1911/1915/1917 synthase
MPRLLLDYLLEQFPQAKRQTLKRMVEDGRVLVSGMRARKLKQPLKRQDQVVVMSRPQRPRAYPYPLQIVHEDDDVLVVSKPAGLLTSTVVGERRPTAAAILKAYLADRQPAARLGVIHRLDRDAGGLLVFSKNTAAYESLKRQFFKHTVQRGYAALVRGKPHPPRGRIESALIEAPEGIMRTTRRPGRGQMAITDYETVRSTDGLSLLKVTLHTGRKHQIRAHFSQRGCPIVGDVMYGQEPAAPPGRGPKRPVPLMLAAILLAFDHPRSGERMTFEIPPPAEMMRMIESLEQEKQP